MTTVSAVAGSPGLQGRPSQPWKGVQPLLVWLGFGLVCVFVFVFLSPIDSCVSFLLLLQYITTDFMA